MPLLRQQSDAAEVIAAEVRVFIVPDRSAAIVGVGRGREDPMQAAHRVSCICLSLLIFFSFVLEVEGFRVECFRPRQVVLDVRGFMVVVMVMVVLSMLAEHLRHGRPEWIPSSEEILSSGARLGSELHGRGLARGRVRFVQRPVLSL